MSEKRKRNGPSKIVSFQLVREIVYLNKSLHGTACNSVMYACIQLLRVLNNLCNNTTKILL